MNAVGVDRTDRKLTDRLLRGDEEAFAEFFDGYFYRLYRFALSRLDDADDAEEVVQATLIRAIAKLGTYRGEAALFTWLCTFCRNEMSALWRRRNSRPRSTDLVERDPEVRAALESLPAALDHHPELELHRRELARFVQVTLDHLPKHYGDALEWKYVEGRSVRQIGERLGISAKAAESLLTRARQAFRSDFVALRGNLASHLEGL